MKRPLASPALAMDAVVAVEPMALDPEGFIRALRATGATEWEALSEAWETGIPAFVEFALQKAHEAFRVAATLKDPENDQFFLHSEPTMLGRILSESASTGKEFPLVAFAACRGLTFEGSVNLPGWKGGLPEDLEITGDLHLGASPALKKLPKGLKVGGGLVLLGCHALEELPNDLVLKGRLLVPNCHRLRAIPDSLNRIRDWMDVRKCHCLESLPEGLDVANALHIADCENLRALPTVMVVGGDLHIGKNVAFTKLPEALTVKGDLHLEGWTAWDGVIPAEIRLGGKIFTDRFPYEPDNGFDARIDKANHRAKSRSGLSLRKWRARFGNGSCFKEGRT